MSGRKFKVAHDLAREQLTCVFSHVAMIHNITRCVDPRFITYASQDEIRLLLDDVNDVRQWLDLMVHHAETWAAIEL